MMFEKNENSILVTTLLITLGLVTGVYWWIAHTHSINISTYFHHSLKERVQPNSLQNSKFKEISHIPSGLFSYGGSTTWAPIRSKTEKAIENVFKKYDLRYTNPATGSPGSGVGIKMLLNNQLAFSLSSRSLKEKEYRQAQKKGFTLTEIPVAIDGIVVAVHPTLNLPGLTIDQLGEIYTGKITNWEELGGPNLRIIPYSRETEGGTVEFFKKNIVRQEKFGDNIQVVKTTTEALRKVARNPGAIFYASAPEVVGQCGVKPLAIGRVENKLIPPYKEPFIPLSQCPRKRNQLNLEAFKNDEYPMTRRLFVIVKQNGQVDEQAGLAYAKLLLTQEGQELISQAGFVRIR